MISSLKNGWGVAKEDRYRQKMLMVVKKNLLCAIDMLYSGHSLSEIRNHLGHDNIKSTMICLHLNLNRRRQNYVAVKSVNLPQPLHCDLAGHIIITTSITIGAHVVTKDEKMLNYPHVKTIW